MDDFMQGEEEIKEDILSLITFKKCFVHIWRHVYIKLWYDIWAIGCSSTFNQKKGYIWVVTKGREVIKDFAVAIDILWYCFY